MRRMGKFEPFRDWSLSNGYSSELVIDRIDPSKNYEPSNCRWITGSENSKRVVHNKYIYYGKSPNGTFYEFNSCRKFAEKHNLEHRSVYNVSIGRYKHHKGWKFCRIENNNINQATETQTTIPEGSTAEDRLPLEVRNILA